MQTYHRATLVHGRYLVEPVPEGEPLGLLVGFHGQGETADIELAHLRQIRGDRAWLLVSVQGLNRYYTRRGDIVAAWMTREDRELAIADNVAYVRGVVEEVRGRLAVPPPRLVYAGFSQGTAMAYRAAAFAGYRADGLLILAGDLPPDVVGSIGNLPAILLGRGSEEEWYTAARAALDLERLAAAGVPVIEHVFADGHVRHPSFAERAAQFLDDIAAGDPGRAMPHGLSW